MTFNLNESALKGARIEKTTFYKNGKKFIDNGIIFPEQGEKVLLSEVIKALSKNLPMVGIPTHYLHGSKYGVRTLYRMRNAYGETTRYEIECQNISLRSLTEFRKHINDYLKKTKKPTPEKKVEFPKSFNVNDDGLRNARIANVRVNVNDNGKFSFNKVMVFPEMKTAVLLSDLTKALTANVECLNGYDHKGGGCYEDFSMYSISRYQNGDIKIGCQYVGKSQIDAVKKFLQIK